MNTNQDIGPRVRSWLHERLTERPDPYPILDEVMSQLPTAPQRRHRWWPVPMSNRKTKTMSSALKFVAAGVIVALFSGFLLAGILTTQQNDEALPAAVTESPSPMTTEELLPGVTLTIEGVEPGVYRVTNDGVRDLASVDAVDIVTGYDGGIWLLREDAFLRLGNDGSHQWPMDSGPEDHAFEVAPDGTMWVIPCGARPFHKQCGDARRSTDGEEWTVQPCPQGSTDCQGFMVAPDGTVWASWRVEWGRWRVGHLGPTGWQPLDGYARSDCTEAPFSGYRRMFVTDAGDIYGLDKCDIFRFEDGGWEFFSYQPSWSPSLKRLSASGRMARSGWASRMTTVSPGGRMVDGKTGTQPRSSPTLVSPTAASTSSGSPRTAASGSACGIGRMAPNPGEADTCTTGRKRDSRMRSRTVAWRVTASPASMAVRSVTS